MVVKVNAMSFSKLIGALVEGPHTLHELADLTGLHYVVVCRYVRELRKNNAVYIAEWHEGDSKHGPRAAFAIGNKKDAVYKRKPRALIQREWRRRIAMAEQLNLARV